MQNTLADTSDDPDPNDPLSNIHTIAIAYTNVKRENYPTEEAYDADKEVEGRVDELTEILTRLGFDVKSYPWSEKLISLLSIERPDLIINLVESVHGNDTLASAVPAIFEMLRIPYLGCSLYALVVNTSKHLGKQVLDQYDIPTPDYELIIRPDQKIPKHLKYPLISKLNNSNGSLGIDDDSVSDNEQELRKKLNYLFKTYNQPVMVEEFIEGEELSASIISDGEVYTVYIGQKVFKPTNRRKYNVCSYSAVWLEDDSYGYKIYQDRDNKVRDMCIKAFHAFQVADYGKIDMRVDKRGKVYFIDVNPNPCLGPGLTASALLPDLYGISFENVLCDIMRSALKTSKSPLMVGDEKSI